MSPDGRPWEVAGHDESRHRPGDEPLWNESYYMDFVAEDGSVGGYVRLGFYPNLGVAWWTTALVRPGEPSVLSLAFDLVPGEAPALEASGPRCTAALAIPDPLSTLVGTSTADAAVFEDPAGVYRGEPGRPADLGLDLTWRTDGEPYHYRLTTRYEIPCLVEGTIHLDGHDVALRGHGQRDHSWGVRDWWAFGWCWLAARLGDGTRVHAADIRIPGSPVAFGYVQAPSAPTAPLTSLSVVEELGPDGFPERGRVTLEPGALDLFVEPLGFAPILLTAPDGRLSRFPRAMARFEGSDGRSGLGWIEWNQPQGPR